MYADEDITSMFAQCREHYAVIDGDGEEEKGQVQQSGQQQQNDENSSGDDRQGKKRAGSDGGSSSSSIERSVESQASGEGYEASSSSSSSQTPNIANGHSKAGKSKGSSDKKNKSGSPKGGIMETKRGNNNGRRGGPTLGMLGDMLAPAQGRVAPPTKTVSFAAPYSSSTSGHKHFRGRKYADSDHTGEPASKASELDGMTRAARKSDPNSYENLEEEEKKLIKKEQKIAQNQLTLQSNELTIEQAMMISRQPRILTQSIEPWIVVHVNGAFTKLSGLDNHVINGQPVETIFFYSMPSAASKDSTDGSSSNSLSSKPHPSSSSTVVISSWLKNSDVCHDRVVDVVCRERYGTDIGPSRSDDIISRLNGTKRCRLIISKVCSFERVVSSSAGSSTSTSGTSSREMSNSSSGDDAEDAILPDSTSASEDVIIGEANGHKVDADDQQSDESGGPEIRKQVTHYMLQLYPCQLLTGPHHPLRSSDRGGRRRGNGSGGGSSSKDEQMIVVG